MSHYSALKVLMFGWEYPPYINGGLGVACYEMTHSLAKLGVKINFVIPSRNLNLSKDSLVQLSSIEDLNQLPPEPHSSSAQALTTESELITVHKILSPLSAYSTSNTYIDKKELLTQLEQSILKQELNSNLAELLKAISIQIQSLIQDGFSQIDFEYGNNLYQAVWHYAYLASRAVVQANYDLIHIHDWMTIPAGVLAKLKSNKPLIVHIHSLETDRCGIHACGNDVYKIEKYGMELADQVIAVSHHTKHCIIKHYNINPNKITVIHNAVSQTNNNLPHHLDKENFWAKNIILYLGRVTFQKGPDYFIEAAQKVLAKRDDIHFVIAGHGDLFHHSIEKMCYFRLARNFHFTGFLPHQQIQKILSRASLFVMPSVSEPFGIAPLEAIVHQVPIIISKQSGVAEVIPHAIKVDFWDTDKLATLICQLIDNQEYRDSALAQMTLEVKEVEWDKTAHRILHTYQYLLNDYYKFEAAI